MTAASVFTFILDRTAFYSIGRALQKGFGKAELGGVTMTVKNGNLTIESEMGGGTVPCVGDGNVTAGLSAKSFCSAIAKRSREKAPAGRMLVIFRPESKLLDIDAAVVRARF
jgi:hypothetical protein